MNMLDAMSCYITGKMRKGQGPATGGWVVISLIITIAVIAIIFVVVTKLMGWNIFGSGP